MPIKPDSGGLDCKAGRVRSFPLFVKTGFCVRRICSLAVVVLAGTVLFDWKLHFLGAHQGLPDFATMKPNTALGFLAIGLGLSLLPKDPIAAETVGWRYWTASALGIFSIVLATLSLIENAAGASLGIDEWIFSDPDTPLAKHPGRMAPATAFGLTSGGASLTSLGLAGLAKAKRLLLRVAHILALGPAMIGYLGLAGYIFDVASFYAFQPFSSMSPSTVLGFLLLTPAVLCIWPDLGWRAPYLGRPFASRALARLLIPAFTAPLFVGALIIMGWKARLYPTGLLPAVFGLGSCALAVVLVYYAVDTILQFEKALSWSQGEARRSNEDFARAQEVGQMGWWRLDTRRDILAWSDENFKIFGVPIGTPLSYDSFLSVVHPDDRALVDAKWIAALAGESYDVEHRIIVGGVVKWVREKAFLEFQGGELLGGFGITQDITARKLADRALKESEERLRLAQASTELGIWDWRLDTGQIFWTPELERIYGIERGHFAGHNEAFTACVLPEDLPELERSRDAAIAEHRSFDVDFRIRTHAGLLRWINCKGAAVYDDTGKPYRVFGVNLDITNRKQVDEALRISEARLSLAHAVAGIGTWDWNTETAETAFNDTYFDLYGLPHGISHSYEDFLALVHPEDRARIDAAMQAAIAGSQDYAVEYRVTRQNTGETRWIAARGNTVPTGARAPTRILGVIYDITERKADEAALQLASRRKDEFLATLAHELRNPLAPLRAGLHVLRKSNRQGPAAEQIQPIMERQVEHLIRLVDDLLDVSRVSQGKIVLKCEPLDLVTLLRQIVEADGSYAERISLHVAFPDEPLIVNGDPVRLTQVFTNLLNNAVKFSSSGGIVLFSAERRGETALVRVMDQGIGIPPGKLSEIFNLFEQIEGPAGSLKKGLGIGLALAKKLVELHGGSIMAESEGEGRGSSFTVRLPLIETA